MQLKMPGRKIVLLATFVVLTLVSVTTVYLMQQVPTQDQITNTKCTYSSNASYDYIAMLEPNAISNNRTTIRPGEGILYTTLTEQINITLNYAFESTLPAQTEVTYSAEQNLQTAAWQHSVAEMPQVTTNQPQIEIQFLPFNRTELEAMKREIEIETGTTSLTYSYEISPTFTLAANTSAGPIYQSFTPTLTINVGQTEQGNTITIDNLQQNGTGAITENVIVTHDEVIDERYASYIFLAACVAGLGVSIYQYNKAHVSIVGLDIDRMMAPYKDLTVEAKEIPEFSEDTPIILVNGIEELAKVAEILAQPILHSHKDNEHNFYVFDSDMTYTYKISQKGSVNS
jgi:hypothetical protein